MLQRIRKRLFSTSQSQQRNRRQQSRSSRRKISNDDFESSSESSPENQVRSSASKGRTRSLSSVPRRDSKGGEKERKASGKNGTTNTTSKARSNSLPVKRNKDRQMVEEQRRRVSSTDQSKTNPLNGVNNDGNKNEKPWPKDERLGTQKVATWLLGSTANNWAPMPVRGQQQQVPPNNINQLRRPTDHPKMMSRPRYFQWSPNVAMNHQPQLPSPPIYVNQELAASKVQPPLPMSPLWMMGRQEGPQSSSGRHAALGQPSMPSRMASQTVPYLLSPALPQSPLKSVWSASESRAPPVNYTPESASRWPWTDSTTSQRINDTTHSETALGQQQTQRSVPKSSSKTRKVKEAVREKKDDEDTKKQKVKKKEKDSQEKSRKKTKEIITSTSKSSKVKGLPSGSKSRHSQLESTEQKVEKRPARAAKVKPSHRTKPKLVSSSTQVSNQCLLNSSTKLQCGEMWPYNFFGFAVLCFTLIPSPLSLHLI